MVSRDPGSRAWTEIRESVARVFFFFLARWMNFADLLVPPKFPKMLFTALKLARVNPAGATGGTGGRCKQMQKVDSINLSGPETGNEFQQLGNLHKRSARILVGAP